MSSIRPNAPRRYSDALFIQSGACNPTAIAQALHGACLEVMRQPNYRGTNMVADDPAVRLIAHQLAFICGVIKSIDGLPTNHDGRTVHSYHDAMQYCSRMVKFYDRPSMVKTTKEQRRALKRVFDRAPIYATKEDAASNKLQTYREFRASIAPGSDCIMVRWCNMWLGIEKDGYTHS